MKYRFRVAYLDNVSLDAATVWLKVEECFDSFLFGHFKEVISNKTFSRDQVAPWLQSSDVVGFELESVNIECTFSRMWRAGLKLLTIESEVNIYSSDLNLGVFFNDPRFVMAWYAPSEYLKWQNCKNPQRLIKEGVDISKFVVKSNGLPPPVNVDVVDISVNPGREIGQSGYFEVLGERNWYTKSLMWGGESSFDKVGGCEGCEVTSTERYVEVGLASEMFDDPFETHSAVKQQVMQLIYPPIKG